MQSLKFQYRNNWYSLAPAWLQTDDAEKYMYTLQLATDFLLEKCYQAIAIRFPGQGDVSQLPYLTHDRGLVQGPAEPDANLVLRLQTSFADWGNCGSARAVLRELQAYMQGLQPGVPATYPLATIVGGYQRSVVGSTTWQQLYQGDAIGAVPTLTTVKPYNWNWDTHGNPWRSWLMLPMALVATGQSGTAGQTTTAGGGSFVNPGQNVNGVWVPATSGTAVNEPFLTLVDLAGLDLANTGQWITISGSSHSDNNGTFQIVEVLSSTSCIVANPSGVTSDTGPLTWSCGAYPWIGPGPVYGSTGIVYGQGELNLSALASLPLTGTFGVTAGSTTVTSIASQVGVVVYQPPTPGTGPLNIFFNLRVTPPAPILMGQGVYVIFASQPGVPYAVAAVTSSSIILAVPYNGPNAAATTGIASVPDTGATFRGTWGPSGPGDAVASSISWGLNVSAAEIQSIRSLVKTWKSARTYYQNIIIAFDAGDGTAGSAFSPNSGIGSGNPDGTWGSVGENVGGVWVPTRLVTSPFDCYCQGTGSYQACSVENVT